MDISLICSDLVALLIHILVAVSSLSVAAGIQQHPKLNLGSTPFCIAMMWLVCLASLACNSLRHGSWKQNITKSGTFIMSAIELPLCQNEFVVWGDSGIFESQIAWGVSPSRAPPLPPSLPAEASDSEADFMGSLSLSLPPIRPWPAAVTTGKMRRSNSPLVLEATAFSIARMQGFLYGALFHIWTKN